jgi:DNA-binding CsgD family transcriptional regulator
MSASQKNKVVIIESSEIIRQGLTRILNSRFCELEIDLLGDISQLHVLRSKKDIDLILLNCALLEKKSDLFDTVFEHPPCIGLVTNSFFREHIIPFADFIYLTDSAEKIADIIKKQLYRQPTPKRRPDVKLTSRELDILKLLIKGYSNKQISNELYISIHTAITHRQNITKKLGIKSIAGLTIYGIINNIIDIENYLHQ